MPYSLIDLITDGLEPTFQLVVRGAPKAHRVPYGRVAEHLRVALGIPTISPRHVGHVVGAMMNRIWEVDEEAPPLNLLVVSGSDWEPGSGGDYYLKTWLGLSDAQLKRDREEHVQSAINDVRSFQRWPQVYQRMFGQTFVPDPTLANDEDYEPDGQPDNPRFGRGGPESDEHRKLKVFVRDNPTVVGIKNAVSMARNEADLLSGDRMDVEFLVDALRVGVEVKSCRSGDADFQRGIYQCVKYRAVMVAESGFNAADANCDVVLVTERPLPAALKSLAKRLGIKHRKVVVNGALE